MKRGTNQSGVKIGVLTFQALSWMKWEQSVGKQPRKATLCWFVVAMAQASNRLRVQRDLRDLSHSALGWTAVAEKP